MDILNLKDVPPPKSDGQGASKISGESPDGAPTPVAPIPRGEPSIDVSALMPPPTSAMPAQDLEPDPVKTLEFKPKIVDQLVTVFDPEIPVNIYELGLIYDIIVDKDGLAVIQMTLTAPGCPAAVTLPAEVQGKVKSIDGITDARVDLVWEPPWDKHRMSDAAKLQLGIFD